MMVAAALIFAAAEPPAPPSGARVEVLVSATIVRGTTLSALRLPDAMRIPAEPLRTVERPCESDPQAPTPCTLIVTDLP